MKAVILPHLKGNLYQDLLARALRARGVKVAFGSKDHHISLLECARRNWKPDIMHIHWTHPYLLAHSTSATVIRSAGFASELAALKAMGVRFVWTVHNIGSHEKRFSSQERFFTSVLAGLSDRIIVHGEYAKGMVRAAYPSVDASRLRVVEHGSYVGAYPNFAGRMEARRKLGLGGGERIFLYFGFIRSYKGLPELLDAFSQLGRPGARLLVAGKPRDAGLAGELKERCAGRDDIDFHLRYIPDDEIQLFMNSSDFVVLPFRDLLTSGSVILAMSFGRPVIAPRMGYTEEVLDREGSLLYDPDEPDGLAEALKRATEMGRGDLNRMGAHNLAKASTATWERVGRLTHEIYKECLRR